MMSGRDLFDLLLARLPLALLLDYDGTLAEFAPTPDYLEPEPDVVQLVSLLVTAPGVTPAILSGRRLDAVEALVPVDGITLAGSYGVEVRTADGLRVERLRYEEIRPFLDALVSTWRDLLSEGSGFFLEDKRWSLAIHARFAGADEAARVLAEARGVAESSGLPEDFRLVGDDQFLEVAPRAANKRDGAEYLLSLTDSGSFPVYFGDDDKDLEAFDAIHRHGGLTVLVGDRFPAEKVGADVKLAGPREVRRWLKQLVDGLSSDRTG